MKRVVLSIVGALAVIAMPALAQTGTTGSNDAGMQMDTSSSTPAATTYDNGATTTTATAPADTTGSSTGITAGQPRSVDGVPVQEERTNAAVPTHTEDSGLTASGTAVSWNDQELVLKTSTGLMHFKFVPETVGANSTFQEGQAVSVDFTRNEQGVLIAKQVRLGDVAAAPPQGITTTGATAAGEAVATTVDQGTNLNDSTTTTNTTTTASTTTGDTTSGTSTSSSMPATASASPLVALLGLLALGAAAGLRRL
jgi:MYXO-CTERM domain-containing protein